MNLEGVSFIATNLNSNLSATDGIGPTYDMTIFNYCYVCSNIEVLFFIINLILGIKTKNKKIKIITIIVFLVNIIDRIITYITHNLFGGSPTIDYYSNSVSAVVAYGIMMITFIIQIIIFIKLLIDLKKEGNEKCQE